MSVSLLTMKISQSAHENICSYYENKIPAYFSANLNLKFEN